MPLKCRTETGATSIRLVTEHSEDYASEYAAIKTVTVRYAGSASALAAAPGASLVMIS